ncbi:hypothetical protein [Fodinicola feengrottensis]|uniref:DUF2771 family protein n=1 Tax=Fodinicola feengrottensis TaxID=435914 RepID=A0ABP4UD93_9ACTN|nr:hypothetical protein [Fodinicola feengrottensis]
MTAVRTIRVLALVVVLAAVALVAGCAKPLPLARLVSGGQFASSPANAFCFDLNTTKTACRTTDALPGRLTVKAGAPVGIEVPGELSGVPWLVRVVAATGTGKTQAQTTPPQLGASYLSLTPDFGDNQALLLEVIGLSAAGNQTVVVSRWSFLLIRS